MVEGLGVGRESLGPERPDRTDQFGSIALRVGHRRRLVFGVDVDRCRVEAQVRMNALEQEAQDAGHRLDVRDQIELDLDPVAELSLVEHDALPLNVDAHGRRTGIAMDGEVDDELAGRLAQGIVGAEKLSSGGVVADVPAGHVPPAEVRKLLEGVGGVVREGPVRVGQIGGPHAADCPRGAVIDRKIGGHLEHDGGNALLGEVGPERLTLSQAVRTATCEGKRSSADVQRQCRVAALPDGEDRLVGLRVAHDEVRDAMTARGHARDEAAPGHGTERRHGRFQPGQRPHLAESLEVRRAAGGDESPDDDRVEAIEPEHDDLPIARRAGAAARAERPAQDDQGRALSKAAEEAAAFHWTRP